MSIILAMAMIMTMIPQTLFAANSDAHLAFRYAGWEEGGPYEDVEETLLTKLSGEKDYFIEGYFYLIEGDNETLIPNSNIYVLNDNIAEVSGFESDPYCTSIFALSYGTTQIVGEVNGETYSMDFECMFPEFGFSKTKEFTEDTMLEDYSVTGIGDVIYYVSTIEAPIYSVESYDGFDDIADFEISADKKVIKITFKALPENDMSYSIDVCYAESEYNYNHEQSTIRLLDGSPGLRYRYASLGEDGYYGDPEEDLQMEWNGLPGEEHIVFFYYIENGVEEQVAFEDLTITSTDVVDISSEYIQGAACVTIKDFGYATIGYTRNGVEYTVDVIVELPEIAFYKEPVVSEENYLNYFSVTKDNNIFYILNKDGYKLDCIDSVYGDCSDYATITMADDCSYAVVEMSEDTVNGYFGIDAIFVDENGDLIYGCANIDIENGKPALVYKDVYYNGDEYVEIEDDTYGYELNMRLYSETDMFFYLKEGDERILISPADLQMADKDIIEICANDENENVVVIKAVGTGTTQILYKAGNETYKLSVSVELPVAGIYSKPVADSRYYLDEVNITENSKEIYYVALEGWKFTHYELEPEFEEYAKAEVSADKTYIKITIDESIDSAYYYMWVDLYNEEYLDSYYDQCGIKINNLMPGLKYGHVNYDEGGMWESEEGLSSVWTMEPGYSSTVCFYYVENGVKTKLKSSELTIEDEDIVSLRKFRNDEYAVDMTAEGCGETTINYTVNGKSYSVKVNIVLPTFGLYSSPVASGETFISDFTVYDGHDQFFLVAREGWTLTSATPVDLFADFAEIEVDPLNNTFATVTVAENVPDMYCNIQVSAVHSETGEETEDWLYLYIENGGPALKFYYGEWEDDEFVENDEYGFGSEIYLSKGVEKSIFFYFTENGKATRVLWDDLMVSDEKFLKVSALPENENATTIEALDFGKTSIYYEVDGKQYSIPVDSFLPSVAFSKSEELTKETYISDFTVTDSSNTFYLVSDFDCQFTNVSLSEDLNKIAKATIIDDYVIKIVVTGTPEEGKDYRVLTEEYLVEYDYSYEYEYGIELINGKASGGEQPDQPDQPDEPDVPVVPEDPTPEVPVPEVDEETTAKVEDNVNDVVDAINKGEIVSLGNAVSPETVENIQKAIANNEEIKTEIVVDVIDESDLSETDTYLIQKELTETQQVVQYLDLSVMIKSVTDDGTEKELGTLDELSEEITFTIEIPEELNVDGREFFVIRVHNGETTILPATMNDDGTISFTTDRFSTYALGYEDVEPPFVPVVPEGVDYAPYYDEATETVKGLKVGDVVEIGTVFSANNLEGQWSSLRLGYKGYEADRVEYYNRVAYNEKHTVTDPDGNFVLPNRWIVSEIEYIEGEIWIDMIAEIPPEEIKKVNIIINWNELTNLKAGEKVPTYDSYGNTYIDIRNAASVAGKEIYESYAYDLLFKVKPEHVEKGYISEYQYNLAVSGDGWWNVSYADESYVFNKNDEYCILIEAFAENGYVFSYDSESNVTNKITVNDSDVTVVRSDVYYGGYRNMGMCAYLNLGTGAEILQKAAATIKLTGWQLIDGKWYFYDNDGQKVCNQWRKDSKGWCFLGEDGAMLTNQWVKDSTGYCFVDKSGYMVYDKWCLDDTGWAYAGKDGYRVTNKWVEDSAGWCYLGSDGYFVTKSWVKDSVGWCYLNENGRMVYDSWVADSNGLCYVGANGYMVTNKWVQHDGQWCYVGSDGYKVTNKWVKDSKGWCYLDADGFMVVNAWAPDSKGEVYLGANGYMVTNKWIAVGDKWCYVGSDGYKVTGQWRQDSKGWCYLGEDGFMLTTQWVKDSVGYCYVDKGGYIVYSQWVELDGNTYYVNASGYRVENVWAKIDGAWYYFKEKGIMARDEMIGNDYVDENGVWVQ